MTVRAAINGFGRTGRAAFRAAVESGADIQWVAINDLADTQMLAQLLRHDTVYGPFAGTVEAVSGALVVNGNEIATPMEQDPARLPWDALDVDVVIESTGRFRSRADAAKHLEAGAKKVIVSAPAKEPDVTVVLGVNFEMYDPDVHRHRVERVVHDELPRTGREAAPRRDRYPPRRDDDRARVHRRPDAPRRAAQGLPPRPRCCCQPRADVYRGGEGDRSRRPGAGRKASRLRGPRSRADGLARRPHGRGRAPDDGRGGQRDLRRTSRPRRARRASCATARSRSSRPTSSSRRTRRSSTRRSRPSSTGRR